MKLLLILIPLLCLPAIADSQTVCFEYAGGVISCDRGDSQYSTQVPLSRNQGVIQSERGVEPYTLFPAPSTRESFRSRPIEPLEPLRSLDSRSNRDRLDDPFSDPPDAIIVVGRVSADEKADSGVITECVAESVYVWGEELGEGLWVGPTITVIRRRGPSAPSRR